MTNDARGARLNYQTNLELKPDKFGLVGAERKLNNIWKEGGE